VPDKLYDFIGFLRPMVFHLKIFRRFSLLSYLHRIVVIYNCLNSFEISVEVENYCRCPRSANLLSISVHNVMPCFSLATAKVVKLFLKRLDFLASAMPKA